MPGLYFTTAPNRDEAFAVGDRVEVYCDHDHNGERVRDWLEGTVVQVDPKMIAVQFQESVYLTDGWMVPDHVLWCPKDSNNIRRAMRRRNRKVKPAKIIAPQDDELKDELLKDELLKDDDLQEPEL